MTVYGDVSFPLIPDWGRRLFIMQSHILHSESTYAFHHSGASMIPSFSCKPYSELSSNCTYDSTYTLILAAIVSKA